eukprot:scaffold128207_cov42-Attheya_sp.AAC.2
MALDLDNDDLDSLRKQYTRLMQLIPLNNSLNSTCSGVATTRKRKLEEYEYSSSDDDSSTGSNTSLFDCSILSNNDDMSLTSNSDMSLCLSETSLVDEESLSSLEFQISLDNSDDEISLSSESDDSLVYSDNEMEFDLDNVDLESPRKPCTRLIPFFMLHIPSNFSHSDVATTRKRPLEEYEFSSSDDDSTTSSESSLFGFSILSNNDEMSLSSDSDMSLCLSETSLVDEESLSSLEFEISLDNSDDETSLSSESDDSLGYSADEEEFDRDTVALESPRKPCDRLMPFITLNSPSNTSYSEVARPRKYPVEEYEYSSSDDDDSLTSSETSLFDISILLNNDDISLYSDSDMSICLSDDDTSLYLDESHFDSPRRVHFRFDLVTEVRFRPRTEPDQVAILFSNQNDWDRSLQEYRRERRLGAALLVKREKRVRFAYDPVTRVNSYPMNTSVLEERNCERFKVVLKDSLTDTNLSIQSSVRYSNEALKPTEGGIIGRRFGQSMNKCKVPHQRIGSNESCTNARQLEEVMAFSCFLAWLSATIFYT